MKKWLYILAAIFFQIQFVSCMDEQLVDGSSESDMTSLKIVLDIPVENAQSRSAADGPDENPANAYESEIKDIYAFAFNDDNKCVDKFKTTYSSGTLTATIDLEKTEADKAITVMVIANLEDQENGSELLSKLDGMVDKTKEQVLKELKYTFSGAWNVAERPLPMWGETKITPIKGAIAKGDVRLYRAVSKINVTVNKGNGVSNDGTDIFKLNSVRVYYARTSGLAGSLYVPRENTVGDYPVIDQASMPDDVEYMPRYKEGETNGILFTVDDDNNYALENKIYVPETNQQGEEPMCLVIGGYYRGSTEETYYRVDFKEGNKGDTYYDALRNHIYNFDITNVKRPGTDIPDPALDHVVVGMDVTITEWGTEYMRGIGGQYTLEVDAGGLNLLAENDSKNFIQVKTTHQDGWKIKTGSQTGNWYTLITEADRVIVTPTKNEGGERRGSFIITSGNLEKVITVRQNSQTETANCYAVSDKNGLWQDLIVTVKGNGEKGLLADGKPLDDTDPNIQPAKVEIIWETAKGLVQLEKDDNKNTIINENGIIKFKIDLSKQNADIIISNQKDLKGGNALIGAFSAEDELLWSWHLWVCPDMDENGDGTISASELTSHLEPWSTGYSFLDRNLGALSNKPGLASLGLLYQWGRKDPFIGVGTIKEGAKPMDTKLYQGFVWGEEDKEMEVEYARKHPTTLSGAKLKGRDYALLWGTDNGFTSVFDAGNKTIYDPCPAGYRVPPVASVVFKSGSSSSANTNWNKNNVYWPNNEDDKKPNYIKDTDSYGFWVNLNGYSGRPTVKQYTDKTKENETEVTGATWLPISGVYDGTMSSFADVDGQCSVTVNSIVWTNSSIVSNGETRPGALFLHGAEDTDKTGGEKGDGRHIHKLIENENKLFAKPSHAGSVRCILDNNSQIQNSIKVPEAITLEFTKGSAVTETLVSITEGWEVVNPGASWFVMTPDEGGTGSDQKITFTATQYNLSTKSRTATLKIKFSDGTTRDIAVTQKGHQFTDHYVSSPIFTTYKESSLQGSIVSYYDDWEITGDVPEWLTISKTSGTALSKGGTSSVTYTATENSSHSPRYATLHVKFGNGETTVLSVSQSGKPYTLEVNESELEFKKKGDSKTLTITSDTNWKVTISYNKGSSNWITVTPNSGSGNGKISIKCSENNSRNDRTGYVTITTTDGKISRKVTIKQKD